jgi:hypothetical protein
MSVRTDANVIGISDTMITKGTSNLKTMKVTVNGEQYFVQTRYDQSDGSTAAVVIQRTETERTQRIRGSSTRTVTDQIDTPFVLFTTDSEGNTTFGGEGRTDVANQIGDISPMHTTTEATAKAILATAQIDGSPATEAQVLAEHNVRTNQLYESSERDTRRGAATRTVQGVTPVQATAPAESTPPVDPSIDPEITDDGQKSEAFNPLNAAGQLVGVAAEKLAVGIDELNKQIKLSEQEVEELLSKMNGGDPIQKSSFYPIDNTFGMSRGQDYVTIDQFEYQAPRREQIFGFKGEPLRNITEGNQRVSPLKKFIAQVKLPMPNSINDSNNVSWGSDIMNNMTAAIVSGAMQNPGRVAVAGLGGNLIGNLLGVEGLGQVGALGAVAYNSTDGSLMNRINQLASLAQKEGAAGMQAKAQFQSLVLGMAGVNVTPESILSRGAGIVPNANMELLFDTPKLRNFEFSWKMTPRDAEEAAMVKAIIRFFKQGMAAKTLNTMAGERALFLGTPNIFRLQYRTANGEIIEGVNRIKPCAVTGTAVNYTPDGVWSAYDEGQPVSTVLTIGMAELEPVYASDYSENVISNRLSNDVGGRNVDADIGKKDGDLYKIRPTEVGY